MNKILQQRKGIAWLILLTFLFTSILPVNIGTAWAATVETVAHTDADGVTVKVFNYNASVNNTELGATGYNFFQGDYDDPNHTSNSVDGIWAGAQMNAMHGTDANYNKNNKLVMSKVLGTDGYPQTSANQSLNYLFNGTYQKAALSNGGGLFQKDNQGYYYYDSAKNAASLTGNRFTLYDYAVRPSYVATGNGQVTDVRMGNFLPFNDSTNVTMDTPKKSDAANGSGKLNELVDLWFGLNVEFDFLMPKNGQLNGQDMIFDFHGDDDVWVYIDDVLVLDIGGTHAAESATINFRTGVATDPNDNAKGKTLREIFTAAKDNDGNRKYSDAEINAMFGSGNTFVDYSQHKLKFFYMERGGNISFCRLRFNLITLPDSSLTVTKEVEMETDNGTTQADIDYVKNLPYKFRVVKTDDFGNIAEQPELFVQAGATYKIFVDGVAINRTGTVDANGYFYLKEGESAQFENLLKDASGNVVKTGYIVQEFIPTELTEQYNGVEYNHTPLSGIVQNATTGEQAFTAYNTPKLNNEETQAVTYRNRVNITKLGKLEISKSVIAASTFAPNQEFAIEVRLNNELLPAGTEYTVVQQGETTGTPKRSEDDGIIKLKANEKAIINNIVAGTTYKVKEVSTEGVDLNNCNVVYKDSAGQKIRLSDLDEGYVTGTFGVNDTVEIEVENESLKTKRTVTKVWEDDKDRDGIRPGNVTVQLMKGETGSETTVGNPVVLTEADGWTYEWTDLPKYENGSTTPINYSVVETKVGDKPVAESGYTSSVTDDGNGSIFTVTNTHEPATRIITVKKRWVIPPNETVTQLPDDDAITVTLEKDNQPYPVADATKPLKWPEQMSDEELKNIASGDTSVILYSEPITWTVPYYENGKELPLDAWDIVENLGEQHGAFYTIDEERTTNGKDLTITLENTYDPIHRSLVVNKIWRDYNNRHQSRPASIDVQLWFSLSNSALDDNEKEWHKVPVSSSHAVSPISEVVLSDAEDSNQVKNFFAAVPGVVTLTGGSMDGSIPWGYIWNNLPQYHNNDNDPDNGGIAISYKVTEVTYGPDGEWLLTGTVDEHGGYDGKQDGNNEPDENEIIEGVRVGNSWAYTITNYHEPAVEISGKKVWADADNQDGIRPTSITLKLFADGKPVLNDENEPVQTTATATDGWSWKFPKQLMYNKNGGAIVYTVTEEKVNGYTTEITSPSAYTFVVTNTHETEKVNQTVKKVWDDADNQDGKRPEELKVTLSNGTEVTLNEANNWTATVENLPKYANGKEIEYTWTESDMPEGYKLTSTSVDGTVTTLTNSYKPETISLTVEKIWDDDNDWAKKRPGHLEIILNDNLENTQNLEVTLNEANDWKVTVKDLPVYANGKKIQYKWVESGMPSGYIQADYDNSDITHVKITNSYDHEFMTISGTKFWEGDENVLDRRPESITVNLLQNGTEIKEYVTSGSSWQYEFTNLPSEDSDGNPYNYTVTEDPVPGYQVAIVKTAKGFDIYNRMIVDDAGQIKVTKKVDGSAAPTDGVFSFKLNVESNIEKWEALEVWEELQLKNAYNKAVEDRDKAKTAWENAKDEFSKNAVQLNTSPSGILFSMRSEVTSPSGISFFEYDMIDKDGYLHNITTTSSYHFDIAAGTTDMTVVEKIIEAIQKIAEKLNKANNTFLTALHWTVNNIAYALGFRQDDAQVLMDTADTLFNAEALVTSTQLAWKNYKPERSTPSAMTLIVKDSTGKEVERINAVGQYEYQFNLKHGQTYSFDIERTTGSVIRYSIDEVSYPTANYSGTEIYLNNVKETDGRYSEPYTLSKDAEYDFLFTNYYNGAGGQGGDTPIPDTITRTITKVWKGDIVNDRPEFVEVEITADGVVDRTVKLSAENNWTYSWTEKNDGILWRVREINVPDGYTSSMTVEDNRHWTITNTLDKDSIIPDDDPEKDSDKDPDPTDNPEEKEEPGTVEPGTPVEPVTPEPDLGDAPDTGDHSNAVPFMALMAVAVIGLAITRRKFN